MKSTNLKNALYKLHISIMMLGVLFLMSCSSVEQAIQPSVLQSTAQDQHRVQQSKKISHDQAKMIAELGSLIISSGNSDSKNKDLKLSRKMIKASFSIQDEQDTLFHVINYSSGGFILISADEDYTPIVAYSQQGVFEDMSLKKKDLMQSKNTSLSEWILKTKDYIDAIKKGKIKKPDEYSFEWRRVKSILKEESLKSKSSTIFQFDDDPQEPGPPNCDRPPTVTRVGPLIAATWNQGCGFNDYFPFNATFCPTGYYFDCDRAWSGCVTVAVAQVMRRWQYPQAFNWSAMSDVPLPPTSFGTSFGTNPHVALLMKQVADNLSAQYQCEGTASQMSSIVSTLHNFGYNSANYISYSSGTYLDIIQNLNFSRPVILGGFNSQNIGHAWNCDGYERISYPCYSVLFFHMNWGWGGSGNGWFYFNGNGMGYTSCQNAVINIAP